MNLNGILKSKPLVIRQMDADKVKEVLEEKVEAVIESKQEEIADKAEEIIKKIDDVADKTAEKAEQAAESVIAKVEEVVPGGAKLVETVDAALVGVGFSCGCLGWKFSVEKVSRK